MYDKISSLQSQVTKTATTNSTGYDLNVGGYPNGRLMARVLFQDAKVDSGTATAVFSIEHSDDNSTFYALSSGAADTVALATAAKSGELFIPITTRKRYVRLVLTVAGSGTNPTITYSGEIGLTAP